MPSGDIVQLVDTQGLVVADENTPWDQLAVRYVPATGRGSLIEVALVPRVGSPYRYSTRFVTTPRPNPFPLNIETPPAGRYRVQATIGSTPGCRYDVLSEHEVVVTAVADGGQGDAGSVDAGRD